MSSKQLKLTPVQTDRGVLLKAELDGKELPGVWLKDQVPVVLDLTYPEDVEAAAEAAVRKRRQIRSNKAMSVHQERTIARDVHAKQQIASGSIPVFKGDVVREGELRFEAKSTRKRSYRIDLDTLTKAEMEAKVGEIPAVVIHFYDGHRKLYEVALCPYHVFKRLVNAHSDTAGPRE